MESADNSSETFSIAGRSDFQALPSFPGVWSLLLAHGKLEWLLTSATHGSFRKRRSVHHVIGCYRSLHPSPEVWFFFPDVLSNRIELDATEPADNPVLETFSEHQSHQSRHAGHVLDTSQVHIGRLSREQLVHVVGLCYSHRTTRASSLRVLLVLPSTTFPTELGWRRSFTEIVSRPSQQPD